MEKDTHGVRKHKQIGIMEAIGKMKKQKSTKNEDLEEKQNMSEEKVKGKKIEDVKTGEDTNKHTNSRVNNEDETHTHKERPTTHNSEADANTMLAKLRNRKVAQKTLFKKPRTKKANPQPSSGKQLLIGNYFNWAEGRENSARGLVETSRSRSGTDITRPRGPGRDQVNQRQTTGATLEEQS